jgi:cell division protein ZapA (FtsZ GTPase activity inhibitor)
MTSLVLASINVVEQSQEIKKYIEKRRTSIEKRRTSIEKRRTSIDNHIGRFIDKIFPFL